jgi:hypothetical protein
VRRLILGMSVLLSACASTGAPPGGPDDHAPPEVIKVTPDSGETNSKTRGVEFQFDEVVSDRPSSAGADVSALFIISPRNGATQASWRRHRIIVRPQKGFRDNTAYRVTLLPGLADLRGNVRKVPKTVVFSTGPYFPQFAIRGRVFDWMAQRPAPGAYVEAILRTDTSVVYLAAADTAGQFDVGPLPGGTYILRGIIDQNQNRALDKNEKWDSATVTIAETSPTRELDAIERDTTPASIDNVTVLDSVTVRVTFNQPLDPALPLQPALARMQRADSSNMEVVSVQWLGPFERARAAADSARRADSVKANAKPVPDSVRRADSIRAARAAERPPTVFPTPGGARPAPAPPKPRAPPPERGIVIVLSPTNPLVQEKSYRVTMRGIRNLLGKSREVSRPFIYQKPFIKIGTDSTKKADTTKKTPPDTTRRPPRDTTKPPTKPPLSP